MATTTKPQSFIKTGPVFKQSKGNKAEARRIEYLGVLNDQRIAANAHADPDLREKELREVAMQYQKLGMLVTSAQVLKEI